MTAVLRPVEGCGDEVDGPRDCVAEARAADLRLYRQLLAESRLSVPEWRDDGSGPTGQWMAHRWHLTDLQPS